MFGHITLVFSFMPYIIRLG